MYLFDSPRTEAMASSCVAQKPARLYVTLMTAAARASAAPPQTARSGEDIQPRRQTTTTAAIVTASTTAPARPEPPTRPPKARVIIVHAKSADHPMGAGNLTGSQFAHGSEPT